LLEAQRYLPRLTGYIWLFYRYGMKVVDEGRESGKGISVIGELIKEKNATGQKLEH
jgi:hypothetical protein